MTPGSFDDATCRHLVGDERGRVLEAQARSLADSGSLPARVQAAGTYWEQVQQEAAYRVQVTAHHKRLARIERMKEKSQC